MAGRESDFDFGHHVSLTKSKQFKIKVQNACATTSFRNSSFVVVSHVAFGLDSEKAFRVEPLPRLLPFAMATRSLVPESL